YSLSLPDALPIYSLSATGLAAIFGHRCALAVSLGRYGKHLAFFIHDVHADRLIIIADRDAFDTCSCAPHRPHFLFGKADRHSFTGPHDSLSLAIGHLDAVQ